MEASESRLQVHGEILGAAFHADPGVAVQAQSLAVEHGPLDIRGA
jgi:hypothetical protein